MSDALQIHPPSVLCGVRLGDNCDRFCPDGPCASTSVLVGCSFLYGHRATMRRHKSYPIQLTSHECRSGLRGAVGLSLSLFVLLDEKIADSRYRTLSFFFMGIVAFLTTLIQGTSMGPLLQVGLTVGAHNALPAKGLLFSWVSRMQVMPKHGRLLHLA